MEHWSPSQSTTQESAGTTLSNRSVGHQHIDHGPGQQGATKAVVKANHSALPLHLGKTGHAQGLPHGFVLFAKGVPAAYLCLEANGEALQYACAGERPDYRQWSAGSIVHLQAFQRLFADVRYRFVDFRPGDNEVKRQFANGSLRSAVVLQVPRTLRNRVLLGLHAMLQRASGNERCAAEVSDEVRTLLASRA